MEKITHEQFMALPEERQKEIANAAFHAFDLKKNLGRVFMTIVMTRQYLDDPLLAQIFSAPMSFLTIILRQKMLAGDFTEEDLRTSLESHLIETRAPDELRMFMTTAVADFMRLGS